MSYVGWLAVEPLKGLENCESAADDAHFFEDGPHGLSAICGRISGPNLVRTEVGKVKCAKCRRLAPRDVEGFA